MYAHSEKAKIQMGKEVYYCVYVCTSRYFSTITNNKWSAELTLVTPEIVFSLSEVVSELPGFLTTLYGTR